MIGSILSRYPIGTFSSIKGVLPGVPGDGLDMGRADQLITPRLKELEVLGSRRDLKIVRWSMGETKRLFSLASAIALEMCTMLKCIAGDMRVPVVR